MGNWKRTVQPWLNLFLETPCPLCQRSTPELFCQACQQQLQRCRLTQPVQTGQQSLPVFAWGSYSGVLKRSLACLKYDAQPQIARPLGHWLAQAWLAADGLATTPTAKTQRSRPVVVPIPLHSAKQQQRGYNQAALLAEAFSALTGLPLQAQGLQRVRTTEAQFGLSQTARAENLVDAFAVGPALRRLSSQPVLLLDDIYTTGATARSAAQALRSRGIEVIGMVAVAQAQRQA